MPHACPSVSMGCYKYKVDFHISAYMKIYFIANLSANFENGNSCGNFSCFVLDTILVFSKSR